MLLSRLLLSVVWNMKFHEFVETSESVAERGIFDSFLVGDYKVIES